jgi:hypothetical protein
VEDRAVRNSYWPSGKPLHHYPCPVNRCKRTTSIPNRDSHGVVPDPCFSNLFRSDIRKRANTGTSTDPRQKWLPIVSHNHMASAPHMANSKQPSKIRSKAWATAIAASGKPRPSLKLCGIARRWMPVRPRVRPESNAGRNNDLIFCRRVAEIPHKRYCPIVA